MATHPLLATRHAPSAKLVTTARAGSKMLARHTTGLLLERLLARSLQMATKLTRPSERLGSCVVLGRTPTLALTTCALSALKGTIALTRQPRMLADRVITVRKVPQHSQPFVPIGLIVQLTLCVQTDST